MNFKVRNNKYFKLIEFVAGGQWNIFSISMFFGIVSGVLYTILFPLLMSKFSQGNFFLTQYLKSENIVIDNSFISSGEKIFLICCIAIFFAKLVSNAGNNYLTQIATVKLRKRIYETIANAATSSLENVGSAKLLSALNVDVASVVTGAMMAPIILSSAVTVLSLLTYLAIINISVFGFIGFSLIFGTASYLFIIQKCQKYLNESRDTFDVVQEGSKALIFGAKELKINQMKRHVHHTEVLDRSEARALNSYLKGSSIFFLASGYAELLVLIVIGVVVFHLSGTNSVSIEGQMTTVMALLYISGPIGLMISAIPQVVRGNVALEKILALSESLECETFSKKLVDFPKWTSIFLNNVNFSYSGDQNENFRIQDINLEIRRGEITFIIGGNGSGKSTLAKLLSFHHMPSFGTLALGEIVLDSENIESARQLVGAIYADFYLFEKISGYQSKDKLKVEMYLKYFRLDGKVKISDEGNYSTLNLSDGQKKRLAMLTLFLEDKEIFVFDEWAADQDPQFKKIFYEDILPDLKSRNKAIIVITHDDAYFHHADNLIAMDFGKLVSYPFQTRKQ